MAEKRIVYGVLAMIAGLALTAALWWLVIILNVDLNAVQLDAKPQWPALILIHGAAILAIGLSGTALVRFARRAFAKQ